MNVVIANHYLLKPAVRPETVSFAVFIRPAKLRKERITGSGDYISSRIIAHERVG